MPFPLLIAISMKFNEKIKMALRVQRSGKKKREEKLLSEFSPLNPFLQVHLYPFSRSSHVPPFWQGFDLHSLPSVEQ